jgi:3-keto-disaccharide hydrolase
VNPQNAQALGWNQYRIEVRGDVITVNLNGVDTTKYTNTNAARGRFSATEPTFVGLQSYSNYDSRQLSAASAPLCFESLTIVAFFHVVLGPRP